MAWKRFVKDYLTFSKKDSIAISFLCCLIVIIYLSPRFIRTRPPGEIIPDSLFKAEIKADSAERIDSYSERSREVKDPGRFSADLFDFDPNSLPEEGWIRLGLKPKTAATIRKYLSKGGHFYKPDDVQKIWGMPPALYERIKDHIRITEKNQPSYAKQNFTYPAFTYPEKKIKTIVDVNSADSNAFVDLPGIGEKLAGRIISFRNKLGGFYAADQLKEVYGLKDSTWQAIRPLVKIIGEVKKIDINTATKEELKLHPYIRWNIANAIVEYRKQHGDFGSVDELKKIDLINDGVYEKLKHYLEVKGER